MSNKIKILVGCDPEIFVRETASQRILSAHGLVPGTKYDPHGILEGLGTIQVDGTALEIGIKPAESTDEWFTRVNDAVQYLRNLLPEYELLFDPVADFDEHYFRTVPDEAKELGCEPDYNAWTKDVNPSPDVSGTPNMRVAGGHIHVGWCKNKDPMDPNHIDDCCAVVKELDYYLGMYSLLWDADDRRRTLYGKAGSFRPKPYGVEYRTLSNKWLSHPALIDWVYYSTRFCMSNMLEGKSAVEQFGNLAQTIIDKGQRNWPVEQTVIYHPYGNPVGLLTKPTNRGPYWKDKPEIRRD